MPTVSLDRDCPMCAIVLRLRVATFPALDQTGRITLAGADHLAAHGFRPDGSADAFVSQVGAYLASAA